MNQDILGLNSIIFERKRTGEYTDDANLYQDIMKYCIFLLKNNNNGSIRLLEWSWLLAFR